MAHEDPVSAEDGRRGRREWLIASLRELLHPLVLAYISLAIGLDAVRAYNYWPDLDFPMHYAGALALTYVVDRSVVRAYHYHVLRPIGRWQRALAVFALVCMISMFWEIGEYLSDRFLGTHAQLGLDDTMTDMLIDVVGSLSFLVGRTLARSRG